MVPVAAIVSGEELVRLLTHLGLPVEFPKTKSANARERVRTDAHQEMSWASCARSPPLPFGEESQIDLTEGYPEEM